MDEIKILTNEELGLYDEFSLSFNPKTKKDYLLKIIQFKKFLEGKDLLDVNKEDCQKFMCSIRETYAKSTSEKIYSYIHSFYSFLQRNKHIEINPFSFVEKPIVSRDKGKDDVLSIQEINKLIDSLYKLNARDRLIMVFLTTTGCKHISATHKNVLEEMVLVIEGTLTLKVEKEIYEIKAGNSLKFDGSLNHTYMNKGNEKVAFHNIEIYK